MLHVVPIRFISPVVREDAAALHWAQFERGLAQVAIEHSNCKEFLE
jgi:hypothetical protein